LKEFFGIKGGFTEQLLKVTGSFLNAATSYLKRVSGRNLRISKCFHGRKHKFLSLFF
jgi:hypothetical protein